MISIIIPTHNRAHLINRAIRSVIAQSYTDWELIVVDDGSTDNTKEVIEPFLKDKRVTFLQKSNTGAADSRNVGVENSEGEYITFLDSDDEAKVDWLCEMIKPFPDPTLGLVCCGLELIDSQGKVIDKSFPSPKQEIFGSLRYKVTNGGVFMLSKEIFNAVGKYDVNLQSGQHTELSFRLIPYLKKNDLKIIAIDQLLIKIHLHKGARIRGNPEMKFNGVTRTLNKHFSFFDERRLLKSKYEAIAGRNAFLTNRNWTSIHFYFNSFVSYKSFYNLLRLIVYSIKNILMFLRNLFSSFLLKN